MRRYLGIVSVIILISTFLVMQFTIVGKVGSPTDIIVLFIGIGLSIVTALFSEKGLLKTILLSLYGILIVGFIIMVIGFAVAHM